MLKGTYMYETQGKVEVVDHDVKARASFWTIQDNCATNGTDGGQWVPALTSTSISFTLST